MVSICADGDEALNSLLALIDSQCPDIVLIEIRLSKLDGYACARVLREQCPSIITAFHTTHRLPCFVNGARQAGADAYFCKPMEVRQLASELKLLYQTNGLLIGPGVLLGGVTGSLALRREPRLSPRMEQVLELEALGWAVKQIADHFRVCAKIIYAQRQMALARIALASN